MLAIPVGQRCVTTSGTDSQIVAKKRVLRHGSLRISGLVIPMIHQERRQPVFVTVDGETIESTFRHPYWVVNGEDLDDRPLLDHHVAVPEDATTPGRWVDAGDLRADILLLRDGRHVGIESIEVKPVVQKVYNFEVEELHNYAVGRAGTPVHNNGDEIVGNFGGAAMDTPIINQLAGMGQLRNLRNDPNLRGVDIEAVLRKTPAQLQQMRQDGDITAKALKQIKKAFEGRDPGREHW